MVLGILLETIYALLASAPDFRPNLLPFFLLVTAAALLSLLFARGGTLRGALLWATLFRATLLWRSPDLSEDLYRYAWDGHLSASSVSPYAYAPDDPRLTPLRNADWAASAHRDARTVYPPAAQALFRVAALTGRPRLALKVAFAVADLAIVVLLARFEGGAFAAALYAAFPLPVFESAGMGHLDSLGVALLLAALLYLNGKRRSAAGAAAALSVMVKYFSLFAILPLVRRGRLAFAAPFLGVAAALWLWASAAGATPAAGLANFATRWSGNSVVYPVVEAAVDRLRLAPRAKETYARWKAPRPQKPWMERVWPFFYPELFARAILAAALGIGLFAIAAGRSAAVPAVFASLALFLLISPVLHPWYVLWLLPFAALRRDPAFLYLAAAAPFGYAVLHPVGVFMPGVTIAIEYAPFAFLLVFRRRLASAGPFRSGVAAE